MEGFRFLVEGRLLTGETYSEVHQTNEDGTILLEQLRVGTYTITELEDENTRPYILPEPQTVEVVHESFVEVTMVNTLPEEVEEVSGLSGTLSGAPDTGDVSRALPVMLVCCEIFSAVLLAVFLQKKTRSKGYSVQEHGDK